MLGRRSSKVKEPTKQEFLFFGVQKSFVQHEFSYTRNWSKLCILKIWGQVPLGVWSKQHWQDMTGGNGRSLLDWDWVALETSRVYHSWVAGEHQSCHIAVDQQSWHIDVEHQSCHSNRIPLVRYVPPTCPPSLVAATKNIEKHRNTNLPLVGWTSCEPRMCLKRHIITGSGHESCW